MITRAEGREGRKQPELLSGRGEVALSRIRLRHTHCPMCTLKSKLVGERRAHSLELRLLRSLVGAAAQVRARIKIDEAHQDAADFA